VQPFNNKTKLVAVINLRAGCGSVDCLDDPPTTATQQAT